MGGDADLATIMTSRIDDINFILSADELHAIIGQSLMLRRAGESAALPGVMLSKSGEMAVKMFP